MAGDYVNKLNTKVQKKKLRKKRGKTLRAPHIKGVDVYNTEKRSCIYYESSMA